jgi:hemerythrin-like domain-containing protein
MTLVHNLLIRGLNCIYLQAPFIPAELKPDFINFMHAWTVAIHHHHMGEEEKYFPWLEEDIGIPGCMQTSVDQHHEFEPGLKAFEAYVVAVKEGKEQYDGQKVRGFIDDFAAILAKHLAEEIEALVGLEKFDTIDWVAYNKRVAADAVANADTVSLLILI